MDEVRTYPDAKLLDDLVRRIREVCDPVRIILFGSAARGAMREHSDLDVMVVLPSGSDVRAAETAIYQNMRGFEFPNDLLVVTEDWVSTHEHNPCLVIYYAVREGRELYRAAG